MSNTRVDKAMRAQNSGVILSRDDAQWLAFWARNVAAVARHDQAQANRMEAVLDHATVLPMDAIDTDVVTIGSIVQLRDRRYDEERIVWIVAPGYESDLLEKVAVTSSLGLSLIGRREGDDVVIGEADTPLCIRKLLYQHRRARVGESASWRGR